MAREKKQGLDYFSHDVDYDTQLELVIEEHGEKAHGIINRIWQHIYKVYGYYMPYNKDELFIIKKKCSDASKEEIETVIKSMLERNLFDIEKYEKYSILTSKRLQSNYKQGTKRRVDADILYTYCIHIENNMSEESTQSKEEEIKEDNIKVDDSTSKEKPRHLQQLINNNLFIMKPLDYQTLNDWLLEHDYKVVEKAIKLGINTRCSNLKYIDKILLNWNEANLKTIEEVDEYLSRISNNNKPKEKNTIPNDINSDWLSDYIKNL